jgi:ABC-2 type transport system permease protein
MLPPFLYRLAHLDPIFHMNQALKPVSALGTGATEIAPHLGFLAAFALLSVALGVQAYGSMLRRERAVSR